MKNKSKGKFFQDVAFRSERDDWRTPLWLFKILNQQFNFDCDVCSSQENALCENYFTKENSCLNQNWDNVNFMNPPYGREIIYFIEKAHNEWKNNNKTIVALLPVRTDTKWFHNYIYNKAKIIFVKGRLRFDIGKKLDNAPFPSMIVIWWGIEKINDKDFLSEKELNNLINTGR